MDSFWGAVPRPLRPEGLGPIPPVSLGPRGGQGGGALKPFRLGTNPAAVSGIPIRAVFLRAPGRPSHLSELQGGPSTGRSRWYETTRKYSMGNIPLCQNPLFSDIPLFRSLGPLSSHNPGTGDRGPGRPKGPFMKIRTPPGFAVGDPGAYFPATTVEPEGSTGKTGQFPPWYLPGQHSR